MIMYLAMNGGRGGMNSAANLSLCSDCDVWVHCIVRMLFDGHAVTLCIVEEVKCDIDADICTQNADCTMNIEKGHHDCNCAPGFAGNGYEQCASKFYISMVQKFCLCLYTL